MNKTGHNEHNEPVLVGGVVILTLFEPQGGDTTYWSISLLHEAVEVEEELLLLCTDLTVVKLETIAKG